MPPRKRGSRRGKGDAVPLDTPELAIIRDRISNFKLSFRQQETFKIDTNPELYKEIKLYGQVLFNEKDQEKYFACCASPDCYTDPTLQQSNKANTLVKLSSDLNENCMSWVTSNPIKHLEIKHGILGKKSRKQRQKSNTEEEERHEMKMKFKGNMDRLCELQWARMIVLARLPFAFSTYKVVRDTMAYTCISEMNLKLSTPRVIHLATEIYAQVLSVVKSNIGKSISAHGKRIFSINVDGWKVKNTPRKFVGCRLYFLDPNFILQTFLLGVREFDPSFKMRGCQGGLRTAMRVWLRGLLETYEIDFPNIFATTTDGAGDVRVLSMNDVMAFWEWCPPHMINRALIYAFGDRNPILQKEIAEMKLTVARIRDHTKDGTLWEEIILEENPEAANMKLKTTQSQRFMSVFLTFSRYYKMHETIEQICGEAQIFNDVTLEKIEIEQMLSLLKPLREISVKSQGQKEAYGFRIMQKLIKERLNGSLNERRLLPRFNDDKAFFTRLTPRVTKTRKLLIEAMDVKYFSRYFRTKEKSEELQQDFLMEAQQLLHPAFRSIDIVLSVIEHLVETESVAVGAAWWKKTKKDAQKEATKLFENQPPKSQISQNTYYLKKLAYAKAKHAQACKHKVTDSVKQHIVDTIMESKPGNQMEEDEGFEMQFARQASMTGGEQTSLNCGSMGVELNVLRGTDHDAGEETSTRTHAHLIRKVQRDLEIYLKYSWNTPAFREKRIVLNIPLWATSIGVLKFPRVTGCFAAFFGIPASASGIENDFYFSSLLLSKHRTSMRGEVAEMVHMVDRNQSLIDLAQVNMLTIAAGKAVMPKFNGDDHKEESEIEEDFSEDEVDIDTNGLFQVDSDEENQAEQSRLEKEERRKQQLERNRLEEELEKKRHEEKMQKLKKKGKEAEARANAKEAEKAIEKQRIVNEKRAAKEQREADDQRAKNEQREAEEQRATALEHAESESSDDEMFQCTAGEKDAEKAATKEEAEAAAKEEAERAAFAEGERLNYVAQVRLDQEYKNQQAEEQALKKKVAEQKEQEEQQTRLINIENEERAEQKLEKRRSVIKNNLQECAENRKSTFVRQQEDRRRDAVERRRLIVDGRFFKKPLKTAQQHDSASDECSSDPDDDSFLITPMVTMEQIDSDNIPEDNEFDSENSLMMDDEIVGVSLEDMEFALENDGKQKDKVPDIVRL